MSAPTRRGLLGGVAALAAASSAAGATIVRTPDIGRDAELIALAERFIANERAIRDWPCGMDGNLLEPNFSRAVMAQDALTSQMGALRATTAEGIAARARCLAAHNLELDFAMDDSDTVTGRLVHHLMRDAAAMGGRCPKPGHLPDAELLEACAAFDTLERTYLATFRGYEFDSPEERASEAERARIAEIQYPIVDRICDLRAVTLEGQAARARSYALWDAEMMKPQDDIEGLFTQAIVRDLIGETGA